jgi:hypothetical protein
MLLDKIIRLAKKNGWKQQIGGMVGSSGCVGTNFFKKGTLLSVSIIEERNPTYPGDDELKDMFGEI